MWVQGNERISSANTLQVYVFGSKKFLNNRAFPGIEQNCAVEFSAVKPLDRLRRSKRKQGGGFLVDDADAAEKLLRRTRGRHCLLGRWRGGDRAGDQAFAISGTDKEPKRLVE